MERVEPEAAPPSAEVADLYRSYSAWLHGMMLRWGAGDAADDIVQETYLRLGRRPPGDAVNHPQAFLLKTARNIMRNAVRATIAAKRLPPADFGGIASIAQADQFEETLLRETIEALPEPLRDVFVMSRFGGMGNEQIAQALNLSVKTVEWRMTKALAFCTDRLRG